MNKREQVISAARGYIGTKWRHLGRNKYGIDCIGLLVNSLKEAGLTVKDRTDYGREPWQDGLREELTRQFGQPIAEDSWQPGDIALFSLPGQTEPSHVGFLGDYAHGGFSLIHTHSNYSVAEHALAGQRFFVLQEVYRCPV